MVLLLLLFPLAILRFGGFIVSAVLGLSGFTVFQMLYRLDDYMFQ